VCTTGESPTFSGIVFEILLQLACAGVGYSKVEEWSHLLLLVWGPIIGGLAISGTVPNITTTTSTGTHHQYGKPHMQKFSAAR